MIEAQGIAKSYGDVRAVDDVSFVAEPGQVLALLGPNGAGKTTALRIVSTLLAPDRGTVRVAGHDVVREPEAVRRSIGYLSTTTGLYPRLTPREVLRWFAGMQGVTRPRERADALIERFDLGGFADRRCETLSTGMRQKVSIARALVHDPPVLVFDEPTSGLDVLVARTFLQVVEEACREGRCILLSTHVMREAEKLADRVAILHEGRILADDTLEALRTRTGAQDLEDVFFALVEDGG